MTEEDLDRMPIGAFARRSGLTASALRFYADAGVLEPAEVDPTSGYRYYSRAQLPRAVLLGELRGIGMGLPVVKAALDAAPEDAARLVGEHVDGVFADAAAARTRAEALRRSLLGTAAGGPALVLTGPLLAAAVDQVLTATTREPDLPVLDAVRLEVTTEEVTLTATDRYRLALRTIAPPGPGSAPFAVTVQAGDLRQCLGDLRRAPSLTVAPAGDVLRFSTGDGDLATCRLLSEPYPDVRQLLAGLPEVTTTAVLERSALLRALETAPPGTLDLRVRPGALTVHGTEPVPAVVTGADLHLSFALTTLYPAVSGAVGGDLLLDLRGRAGPVTVRSADHGDLTTLVMPTRPA